MGAATRAARRVKLAAKPRLTAAKSLLGEEREPRRPRAAASAGMAVGATTAASALAFELYGDEAIRSEWEAALADHSAVLAIGDTPLAPGWQQGPAWAGRPEPFPQYTGQGRRRGTLAPGTPMPARPGTVYPHSGRAPRAPRGGGPPGVSWSDPPAGAGRRRGACSYCGHPGHWVFECPEQTPEQRAHGRALREAVLAHRSGRGPALPPPKPMASPGRGTPGTGSRAAGAAEGAATFVHAVETDDRPDATTENGSSEEGWVAPSPIMTPHDLGDEADSAGDAQGNEEGAAPPVGCPLTRSG